MAKKADKIETPVSKDQKIELALSVIRKAFGQESILTRTNIPLVEFFTSGCLSLDKALGGGWAKGRMIEIIGMESSGKSTLALHAIAEIQKLEEVAAYIDTEHALDPTYAEAIGVNLQDLLLSQPSSAEEALNIVETLIRTGVVKLIVVDSVAALTPQNEIEGDFDKQFMGLQARLMSKAMRKLVAICHQNGCTVIWINQIRQKIGIIFGSPEVACAGNSLKFYASQRVDTRRTGGIKAPNASEEDTFIANSTRAKVIKNKVAPPFKEAEFNIIYGEGIDVIGDVITCAVEENIIQKSGSWYSMGEERIGQGQESIRTYFKEHPEVLVRIIEQLKNK